MLHLPTLYPTAPSFVKASALLSPNCFLAFPPVRLKPEMFVQWFTIAPPSYRLRTSFTRPPSPFAGIVLQILLHSRRTIALESIMGCAYLRERLGGADLGTKKKLCPLSLVLLLHRGSGMENPIQCIHQATATVLAKSTISTCDDYYDPCKVIVAHCLIFLNQQQVGYQV
ncbi:hypothetical protein C8J56DRAFT_1046509 [Mycena floridula]|nr:hypothetical protein C8J56DRAFT_1046509 [Mycena floridula]